MNAEWYLPVDNWLAWSPPSTYPSWWRINSILTPCTSKRRPPATRNTRDFRISKPFERKTCRKDTFNIKRQWQRISRFFFTQMKFILYLISNMTKFKIDLTAMQFTAIRFPSFLFPSFSPFYLMCVKSRWIIECNTSRDWGKNNYRYNVY